MKSRNKLFSVRCIIRLPRRPGTRFKYLYEERITLWRVRNINNAINCAENEACAYMKGEDYKVLNGVQAYWLYDEELTFQNGTEVFSLIRGSNLTPAKYLKYYFVTGTEHANMR